MKYDELDDDAKTRARGWFASTVFEDSSDWDGVYTDAVEIGALMGIVIDTRCVKTIKGISSNEPDISFSGFSSQGDGACFSALLYIKDMAGCVERVKAHAPADESLHALAARAEEIHALINAYQVARRLDGHDVDTDDYPECSTTMSIVIVGKSHHGFGTMMADDCLCPLEISEAINKLVEDFAEWIYKNLEAEYDHQTDDETVEENIRANNYEFDEDGSHRVILSIAERIRYTARSYSFNLFKDHPMPAAPRSRVADVKPRVIPIKENPALLKPPMKSWSFSSLGDFEKCKYYSYLKRVQKIPEPERPLPPGKTEHANDRGSRIHDYAEQFVRGKHKGIISEMRPFETEFMSLRESFKAGKVSLEGEWGMDDQWTPADWKKAWLRLKLDALVFLSPTEAVAVDYKTGRKFGNEVKHAEQLQLYQLVTFLRYPQLETVHTELWYLDQDELTTMTYQRGQGLRFRQKWNQRAGVMMNAVDFPPSANIFSCRFCMYGPKGSGVCTAGVM